MVEVCNDLYERPIGEAPPPIANTSAELLSIKYIKVGIKRLASDKA